MMTCKEVSLTMSTGELETGPVSRRMAVWLHLAMCRPCRAFRRQLRSLGRAARHVSEVFEREPSGDFERTILKHLQQ
jgi:hypothetical protein